MIRPNPIASVPVHWETPEELAEVRGSSYAPGIHSTSGSLSSPVPIVHQLVRFPRMGAADRSRSVRWLLPRRITVGWSLRVDLLLRSNRHLSVLYLLRRLSW